MKAAVEQDTCRDTAKRRQRELPGVKKDLLSAYTVLSQGEAVWGQGVVVKEHMTASMCV